MSTSGNIGIQDPIRPVFYDFKKSSIDIDHYFISTQLDEDGIGLQEARPSGDSAILVKILNDNYKKVEAARSGDINRIIKATEGLLCSLYNSFIQECEDKGDNDFNYVFTQEKEWVNNTIKCINEAFSDDVLPDTGFPFKDPGIPYYPDSWFKCDKFRRRITEYCISLVVSSVSECRYNPYIDAHGVIPFNYYGDDYPSVVENARKAKLKTLEDWQAIDYFTNYQALRYYLEKRLSILDGKEINDESAEFDKQQLVTDLIKMANSYLDHLGEMGENDGKVFDYAIDFWNWIVKNTMDCLMNVEFMNASLHIESIYLSQVKSERIINTVQQYGSFKDLFIKQMSEARMEFTRGTLLKEGETIDTVIKENISNSHNVERLEGDNLRRKVYSPLRGVTINVPVIYSFIKDNIYTELSIKDFEDAILYADFSKLLSDGSRLHVKDYPLLLICKLKEYFDDEWYKACCNNLHMEPKRVSGYHKDGSKMRKLYFRFPTNLTM